MELILLENYPSLGYVGDQITVKRGFARNYLIPKGIAVELRSRSAKELQHKRAGIDAKKARMKQESEQFAEQLGQVKISFKLKVGEHGKSFGSITAKDIEAELGRQGIEIERKQIRLGEPIKSAGSFQVEIKLHSEVSGFVTAEVEAQVIKKKEKAPARKKVRAKEGELEGEEGLSEEEQQAIEGEEISESTESASEADMDLEGNASSEEPQIADEGQAEKEPEE